MVHWTDEERAIVNSIWSKINVEQDGHDFLTRMLAVYPWTQRYFGNFGDLSNVAAISANDKVKAHGKLLLTTVGQAIQHMDDMKHYLADLSKYHAQKLYVDPENFKRFGEVMIIVLSSKMGTAFTAENQAAWEKLNNVLVSALSHRYF